MDKSTEGKGNEAKCEGHNQLSALNASDLEEVASENPDQDMERNLYLGMSN